MLCTTGDVGQDGWQPSLLKCATDRGVRTVTLEQLYPLKALRLFSLAYDKILDVSRFSSRCLYNLHFSALPAYRGMYPAVWPILNGETASGVTLHELDAGIDTGNIIDQIHFDIPASYTSRDLYLRGAMEGKKCFALNWQKIVAGEFTSTPQPVQGASYYSKSSIDFSKATVDLRKTACEVERQVRAFSFAEYQIPVVHGHRVYGASILTQRSKTRPGRLVHDQNDFFIVSSIDYDVKLHKTNQNSL